MTAASLLGERDPEVADLLAREHGRERATVRLIAAGVHPDPVPHADIVTMSTHKTLRGPRGGLVLCRRDLADAVERSLSPRVHGGPDIARIAATAVALREAGGATFRSDARRALRTAKTLVAVFADAGLRVVTGGTDMVVVDLAAARLSAGQRSRCAPRRECWSTACGSLTLLGRPGTSSRRCDWGRRRPRPWESRRMR